MTEIPPQDTNNVSQNLHHLFQAFMNPEYDDLYAFAQPDYGKAVVRQALDGREGASEEAKLAFSTVIQDSAIQVDGFRRPEIAPSFRLVEPVVWKARFSPHLAGAVLRLWAEAHNPLQDAVSQRLKEQNIPTPGLDFAKHRLCGAWDYEHWQSERDEIVRLHQDLYDEDDVALMLCCVSGKMPGLAEKNAAESPESMDGDLRTEIEEVVRQTLQAGFPGLMSGNFLDQCIEYLSLLPPDAPDWEQAIPEFVVQATKLIEEKEAERHQAANLDTLIGEIGEQFSPELGYLEQDISSWSASGLSSSAIGEALHLAGELQSSLAEYRPIREQAPVRSEEQIRAVRRTALESSVLSAVKRIHKIMSGWQDPDDAAPQPQSEADEEAEEDGPSSRPQSHAGPADDGIPTNEIADGPAQERNGDAPEAESDDDTNVDVRQTFSEHQDSEAQPPETPVVAAPAVSEEEYTSLQTENRGLRQDVEDLKEDVESLRNDLHDSRTMEESWRLAYQKERQEPAPEDVIQPPPIDDVNTAVKLAKQQFKGRLLFQPNSESDIETNPFNTPQTVWEALRWLATTYYQSRIGGLRVTDFDLSIREACGWWYKSDQHDSTMRRYPNSYSIQVNGKRYWLAEHVGKGTSWDARYTIRIGFDWDKNLDKVVVGFIGQHQQTDAS